MPLISVIMPVFNAEKYINEAIESILNQTFFDFELCICDDGSTDGSYDICKKFESIDSRIRIFKNNRNIGNLKTTNFLFSQCKGDYIAIQDADDYSIPERFQLLWNEFEKDSHLGIVGSNYMITDEGLNAISCGNLPLNDEAIRYIMEKEVPPILYGSILVKKEILEKVGFLRPVFNRKGYADLDLLYRICEVSKSKNIKQIAYFYRQNGGYKYPKRGVVVNNGMYLVLEAHVQRLKGEKDFIAYPNYLKIRRFLKDIYFKKAEQAIWNNEIENAHKLFISAFKFFPFDIKLCKNIIKLIFKYKV
jgi:glycosyltransferase involved in cell wall biosynthesis